MADKGNHIYIGTSGWSFDSWIGSFYPKDIKNNDRLSHYAETFSTVELNNSFYQLPSKKSIQHWLKATSDDFIFSCKASRYITHMKKLNDAKPDVDHLFESLEHFGEQLGPVLFQLPPNWHMDIERLAKFVRTLPKDHRYTFEFRDKSWLCEQVYDLLEKYDIALCFYDFKGYQSPEVITSDFIYVRLHGPTEQAYEGAYDGRTLAGYAQKFIRWQKEGKSVFCYFDNDQKANAPKDAVKLMDSLERQK